ncbi:MAG TPA: serine/threonine-protein kinase [Polyangia bacterium]|nr:serine/threonine-protein kinase [Polyangia bacterium]
MVGEGQTLDETYYLQRLLGEGGMGSVYEATHARLAGRYAIKVLLPEHADCPEVRARFDREARVTSLLQHPNIVQVIDHNLTNDGTSYFVMEYLSGESLAARLARDGRLAAPAVVDIVDQIAGGLAAAHAHEIVHRDLKPDNVFLVPVEGRPTALVKILDFGISKVSGTRDATAREICGTPQYMAPEQAEGRVSDIDGSTDQYALAVIAYEMLTGENPFVADTIEAVLLRVANASAPPTRLAVELDSVLQRALAKDKALRFPSVRAFAEAFRTAVRAIPEPQPTVTARSRRGHARSPRLGIAAAAAIALTSFLGTGAAHRAPAPAPEPRLVSTAAAPAPAAPLPRVAEPIVVVESATPVTEVTPPRRSAEGRTPARRPRAIPAAVPPRTPQPVLAPDEDATLPPSDL